MMADLMHQNMRDEMTQRLLALRPAIKQRAAVKEYHVRAARQIHHALLLKADTVVKPHQVEWALELQRAQHLFGGKVLHPHDDVAAHVAQRAREPRPCRRGELLEIAETGCPPLHPLLATCHGLSRLPGVVPPRTLRR